MAKDNLNKRIVSILATSKISKIFDSHQKLLFGTIFGISIISITSKISRIFDSHQKSLISEVII